MRSTARPVAPLPKRSALAGLPGVPWWGAVVLAVGCTAIGASTDILTSAKSVGDTFNWLYAIGCVLAALLVANTGLFTAAVQPSLILFVSVPVTTWILSPDQQASFKSMLLFAVPLIGRFPWMAWVSGIALAICLVRWALWRLAERREANAPAQTKPKAAKKPVERRVPSSVPPRRHRSSPAAPVRALAGEAPRRETGPVPRRRMEPPPEHRTAEHRTAPSRSSTGPVRPRIDPRSLDRGLDPLRHTPSRGLPPLPSGVRYRQEPATTRSGAAAARGAKHAALPPARVPAPQDLRQPPQRRRRFDYED
ncbi:MAG: DUF6542 domain-containing protein [Segniliparus sp.]|uniref:DUF6542 domain-containing protein n=1 Tax=Segniliparus sp. TaxID=2804064 RepID=UPI003F3CF125